jgi:hypothetical protein
MNFIQRYNTALRSATGRKVDLHIVGQTMVAIAAGVLLSAPLTEYAGLMLIVGILLMLPLLAKTLGEHHKAKKKRRR